MSWLTVTCLYGFAVGASAAGYTPVTRIANSADPGRVDAASPTPEASFVEAAAPVKYEAASVAVAGGDAASGAPVFLWKETVTRHIPEKNTWEVSVQTLTDYQADIDYEPEDFEAKVKGITTEPAHPTSTPSVGAGGVESDVGGVPMVTFGGPIPTDLPVRQDEVPDQGPLTTAMAYSTFAPAGEASSGEIVESSVTVYPAPEFTEVYEGGRQFPHPHRSSKVGNARVTPRPLWGDILMSLAPKFDLTTSKRTYAWDINTEIASMQNQEVYFPVSDEVGHDIIKASVGISPSPLVKIAGASETLSVGGSPVTYKGHTFTLAPEGIKVGTQTFSMAAIAPAYNTNYQAILTIDENQVTFIKDAANPTIMTAPGMTAQLGGPALVTGTHQILYNTDGALILDGTISVEPTMIPKPGMPSSGSGFEADAQGKSPSGLLASNGEANKGPLGSENENENSDSNGANSGPSGGSATANGAPASGGASSGSRSSGSQNQNAAGSESSGGSGSAAASPGSSRVSAASGSSTAKIATASPAKNGTAKSSTHGSSAGSAVTIDGTWVVAVISVMTFTFTLFSL